MLLATTHYLAAFGLLLSADKSTYLPPRGHPGVLLLGSTPLPRTDCLRYLGFSFNGKTFVNPTSMLDARRRATFAILSAFLATPHASYLALLTKVLRLYAYPRCFYGASFTGLTDLLRLVRRDDPFHLQLFSPILVALKACFRLGARPAVACLLTWLGLRPPGFVIVHGLAKLWDAAFHIGLAPTLLRQRSFADTWAARAHHTLLGVVFQPGPGPIAPCVPLVSRGLRAWVARYWTVAMARAGKEAEFLTLWTARQVSRHAHVTPASHLCSSAIL